MRRLVNQLVELSTLDEGRLELSVREHDLVALVRRIVQDRVRLPDWMEPREASVTSEEAAFLEALNETVDEYIDNSNFGVDWLAGEMDLSARHLRCRLKETTSLSAAGFVRTRRLQHAASLLQEGVDTISDVASAVGYRDPSYFSRLFRETFGCSPTEYAEQEHESPDEPDVGPSQTGRGRFLRMCVRFLELRIAFYRAQCRGDDPRGLVVPHDSWNHYTSEPAMRLECSIRTPLFSSVRASTTSTRVPPVLLATLVLLATGCSTIHRVSHDPSNGYGKVTNAAAGETARVHLRDGRTTKLDNLYVDADSTTGVTPQGTKRAFPTSAVREIEIVNRGKGILQGAGIGAIPLPIGGLLGASTASGAQNDLPVVPIVVASLSLPGIFVGGIIGGIRGARETYRFSNASPEADSAKAALRNRIPENRHRAAEHP